MSANLLIACPDENLREHVSNVLQRQGYAVSGADVLRDTVEQIALSRPDLLILAHQFPESGGIALVRRLRTISRTADLPIVVTMPAGDLGAKIDALDAGADAVLVAPVDEQELTATVRGLLARAARARSSASARDPGQIFTFFSAKGGVGTTSLCVNTAVSLAEQKPKARIVCVDLVLPFGAIGYLVGVESEDTVAALSTFDPSQLDTYTIDGFLQTRERLGLSVLLGARDPAEAQTVKAESIGPLIQRLQQMADYVFVDIGRAISRISLPAIKASQRMVMVVASDTISLKLTRTAINYFRSLGMADRRMALVVNRAVGREGLSRDEIEAYLKQPILSTVPFEGDRFSAAISQRLPLVLKEPSCSAAISIRELAALLTQP